MGFIMFAVVVGLFRQAQSKMV